jgi:hypothetical protein
MADRRTALYDYGAMARHGGRGRRTWDDEDGRSGRDDRHNGWTGRRRQRARQRPARSRERAAPDLQVAPITLSPPSAPELPKTCGRCQEWVADEVGGRGECLHPGSGMLKPWWETPACPFFR